MTRQRNPWQLLRGLGERFNEGLFPIHFNEDNILDKTMMCVFEVTLYVFCLRRGQLSVVVKSLMSE